MVTGASTGIGKACVAYLTARGFIVWGSVRRQEDADRLKQEFGDAFRPLMFDVTDPSAITSAAAEVGAEIGTNTLAGLVNNAGVAESGPLKDIDPENIRSQIEINVIGPLMVSQAFVPLLGADGGRKGAPGRIVNMSSVSGKRAMPFLGPYAMSKFALEAQSDAFRRELMMYGIDVIVVEPGPILTPIWDKAAGIDVSVYQQSDYFSILEKFQAATLERAKQGLPAEE
ncbi:MAG: SDR family NAD(P)-dependent oxidoreductase, partial [Phycisphaerales bacterium]|nr:SDR family NAD(P)-dependent oxidoreductase [Phycisphaerales bacterium]